MSLVERALKKLQESRNAAGEPALAPAGHVVRTASEFHAPHRLAPAPVVPVVTEEAIPLEPARRVSIDRGVLRTMGLLAPEESERQVASQYQQVKRPLIASALGKTDPKIPNGHLIMLASALPGEGKTFTSINLALSMAREKDTEVLLVDADVAKPHVTKIFGLQSERGLLDLLVDGKLRPSSLILPTDIRGLSLLPAGQHIDNATELLASERMLQVALELGSSSGRRIVLFDSPPLLLSTESRALIAAVGQVVLVVRAEVTAQQAVRDAIEAVGGAKPMSLILNQGSTAPAAGYYGYGSYGEAKPQGSS